MRAYVKKVETDFLGKGEARWRCQIKDGTFLVAQFFTDNWPSIWFYLDTIATDVKKQLRSLP